MARTEDFPQPTPRNKTWNTAQRLKPEQARKYRRDTPSKQINSYPLPEILYIRETWVNDYITRKNKMYPPPIQNRPFRSFFHSPPILF